MSSGIPGINIDWGPKINNKLVYIELSTSDQKSNILINPYLRIENGKNGSILLEQIRLGLIASQEKLINIDKTIQAKFKEYILVLDEKDPTSLSLPLKNPSTLNLTLKISPFHNRPNSVILICKAILVKGD